MCLLIAALTLELSPEDIRRQYRAGQPWADSGRSTAACLVEINDAAPGQLDLSIREERDMVAIRAQVYAGLGSIMVENARAIGEAMSVISTDFELGRITAPKRDAELARYSEMRASSIAHVAGYSEQFPSCRFFDRY